MIVPTTKVCRNISEYLIDFVGGNYSGIESNLNTRILLSRWKFALCFIELDNQKECLAFSKVLKGVAAAWYNTLPTHVKINFDALETEFRATFIHDANASIQQNSDTRSPEQESNYRILDRTGNELDPEPVTLQHSDEVREIRYPKQYQKIYPSIQTLIEDYDDKSFVSNIHETYEEEEENVKHLSNNEESVEHETTNVTETVDIFTKTECVFEPVIVSEDFDEAHLFIHDVNYNDNEEEEEEENKEEDELDDEEQSYYIILRAWSEENDLETGDETLQENSDYDTKLQIENSNVTTLSIVIKSNESSTKQEETNLPESTPQHKSIIGTKSERMNSKIPEKQTDHRVHMETKMNFEERKFEKSSVTENVSWSQYKFPWSGRPPDFQLLFTHFGRLWSGRPPDIDDLIKFCLMWSVRPTSMFDTGVWTKRPPRMKNCHEKWKLVL